MSSTVSPAGTAQSQVTGYRQRAEKLPIQLWLAALLGVVLLATPRTRVVFGAPIYLIDFFAIILLVLPLQGQLHRWVPKIPISRWVPVYLVTILLSEGRGMLQYGLLAEPVYMMVRFGLAISMFYTIPRLVSKPGHINLILKGVVLGTLMSAIIVILYSLGPTRGLVVSTLFANSYLNPGWQRLLEIVAISGAGEAAMRGRSLVGAATMTAGFLSVTWPLAFIAYSSLKREFLWKWIGLAAIVLAPIGVLMTYGRGAWIMVGVVVLLISVFGLASGRKILFAVVAGATIAATQLDIDSDLFYFDRITTSAQETIDNPFTDASTAERLLSFVQPFGHLMRNPSWFIAGAGRAGNRVSRRSGLGGLGGQLYNEGGSATHSGFAMAYYSFGVTAAMCQVLFIIFGFRFILSRVFRTATVEKDEKIIWQGLLMSWCTYSLWWASGHAMIGEPRGMMLAFFLFGLLVAFEKLRLIALSAKRNAALHKEWQ